MAGELPPKIAATGDDCCKPVGAKLSADSGDLNAMDVILGDRARPRHKHALARIAPPPLHPHLEDREQHSTAVREHTHPPGKPYRIWMLPAKLALFRAFPILEYSEIDGLNRTNRLLLHIQFAQILRNESLSGDGESTKISVTKLIGGQRGNRPTTNRTSAREDGRARSADDGSALPRGA